MCFPCRTALQHPRLSEPVSSYWQPGMPLHSQESSKFLRFNLICFKRCLEIVDLSIFTCLTFIVLCHSLANCSLVTKDLAYEARAKTLSSKTKSKAKTFMGCSRGSSKPRPGQEYTTRPANRSIEYHATVFYCYYFSTSSDQCFSLLTVLSRPVCKLLSLNILFD